MSYFGHWPTYKTSKFRGPTELLWKAARASWKLDRVLVPVLLPVVLLAWYAGDFDTKDAGNPYDKVIQEKLKEGKYNGEVIGLRQHRYT